VEFQYNRVGERIWKRGQNGTVHHYEFDSLGRLLHDRVTTLGSGVDGSVKRISTQYNIDGQIAKITSYDNATIGSGSVVNEVKYEYDTNDLLAKELQNPSGVVTGSSLYTGYTYDTTKNGDFFTKRLRLAVQKHPDGIPITYECGTNGSSDDLLNHVVTLKYGSTSYVSYAHIGFATITKVTYSPISLTLDYTASGALDRFGRITDHAWKKSDGTDMVRIKHGYDRVGNRIYREDVAANAGKAFDELYSYDGMNQLIDMQRGTLNTAKTGLASGKNYAEQFTFDATGNFANYKQDATGDGTFELNQNRTHSKANEILTVAGVTSHVAHDKNGNMTKCVKPDTWAASYTLTYDAWNRLVTVKDGSTVVASYLYDALNRRVKKVVGSETRTFYFNNRGNVWKSMSVQPVTLVISGGYATLMI
jgi:YD repeat-containing protein